MNTLHIDFNKQNYALELCSSAYYPEFGIWVEDVTIYFKSAGFRRIWSLVGIIHHVEGKYADYWVRDVEGELDYDTAKHIAIYHNQKHFKRYRLD